MKSTLIATLPCLAALLTLAGHAQERPAAGEQLKQLRENVRQAHLAKDADSYLSSAEKLHDFLNGSPQSVLQLMSAQAFAQKQGDALRSLSQFVNMGQASEESLQAEPFKALRDTPQYVDLHRLMLANNTSKSVATESLALADAELNPEDIDYDSTTKLFYISSVLKKQILSVTLAGETRLFATAPDSWPMMALKVDSKRHTLWATEVALNGFVEAPSKDWGRSAILLYDLNTGKLLHRIEGPPHTALGDMTLIAGGDAIVSDGDQGGVYRVHCDTQEIERLDAGDFISPQTPAVLPDGLHLLVPDYLRGIGILDLKTKNVSWIPMDGAHALNGIDGLYLAGSTLLATQNGSSPERVISFKLDSSLSHIESESIIERATPTLGDPTHGVVVDGTFYYIANSGWDTLDDHGNRTAGAKVTAPLIMRAQIH